MRLSRPFLLLICSFQNVSCYEGACLDGISTAITEFVFRGGTADDYYGNLCTNKLSVHSMWAAAKLYCTPSEITAGETLIGGWCAEYGSVALVPYSKVLPDLTDDYISSLQVVNYEDINATKIWSHSVLLSQELAVAGERTTTTFNYEYKLHQNLGWSVYAFWGVILAIASMNNLYRHWLQGRLFMASTDIESTSRASNSTPKGSNLFVKARHWLQTNMIVPATFGTHHRRLLWWCSIPTRSETAIITVFWVLNLVICCVDYEIFVPNLYYNRAQQKWRYIADRTGIVSYANLPWLWMFSGRNNIFIWLTGWNFATFNVFHRNVARVATIQAIVHSLGYTGLELSYHDLAVSWKQKYWYMGGLATIVMSLLLVGSSIFLRKSYYELFLLMHIVGSVVVIAGLWYHTEIFDGEWDPYLWPLVAIWVFDRVVRIVRVAYCNISFRNMRKIVLTRTVVTYDKEAHLITMNITPGSRTLKPSAGQHYFIYQPLSIKCWENHPFTLASWHFDGPVEHAQGTGKHGKVSESAVDKEIQNHPAEASTEDSSSSSSQENHKATPLDTDTKVTFYLRPFDSWTNRLANSCLRSTDSSSNVRILIEGPYGDHYPLHTFENVVFFVGGSGITGALPYLQEHLSATVQGTSSRSQAETTRTRHVTLIWTAKQSSMITNIFSRELQPLIGREDIDMRFHATSKRESLDTIEDVVDKASPVVRSELDIVYGRPDIKGDLLHIIEDVHAAGTSGGRLAVFTCGPAEMTDEARATVHQALKAGKRDIEYFEESFGW